MSLALLPDQPADRVPLATVITTEGTPVRLFAEVDGALTVHVGGRHPITLDRFQAGALRQALASETMPLLRFAQDAA